MLRRLCLRDRAPSPATASVVICSTCRFSKEARSSADGRTGGALFAEALAETLGAHACRSRIDIQTMACLFACTSSCTAYIRSEGRFGYILGRFSASREHAAALLDYVAQYLSTADGMVAYANWPQGIKGHFLARVPPDGFILDTTAAGSA